MRRSAQISSSHCGPAVLQMLLSLHGVNVLQKDIAKVSQVTKKIRDYGMTVPEMAKAIKTLAPHLTFWFKDNATAEDMDYILNTAKHPVGIEWQGIFGQYADEDDGHYSIITAIDIPNNKIKVSDPYRAFAGHDRIFRLNRFLKRWWDINEILDTNTTKTIQQTDNQMMFVITSKVDSFPAKLGMKYS